jgi:aminocarboxymuconate-semialdehyde decarboxylase
MPPSHASGTDVHAHFVVPEVFAVTSAFALTLAPASDPSKSETERADIVRTSDGIVARMSDVSERISAMDAMGVERQVLSPSLVHQCTYELPSDESLRLERLSNEWIAMKAATAPDRFIAVGSVPLQVPELATAELRRCMRELGLRGIAISTYGGGREIGDPGLHCFWREAEALGAAIYVHPAGNRQARFAPFALWNSVGQCFEETMAIASLIYQGVLEHFPKLRICVSHGGGYMPHNMGRIDRNWLEKPATRINMKRPPADYLRMLWFDSCVYDADVLRHLVDKVGEDRVVLGSDYPVGEKRPIGFIESAGFNAQTTDKIIRSNARDWLGE